MFWKRSIIVMALLTLGLLLVACEIPLGDGGEEEIVLPPTTAETTATTTTETTTETITTTITTEGTTAEQPAPETAEGGETPATGEETSPRPETETAETPAEQPATTTETTEGGETAPAITTEEQPATTTTEETPAETPAETTAEQPATTTTEQPATTTTNTTGTHTVVAGDNLYRIGLQYGVSWVVLAQYNNLPNANSIVVGQMLRIPTAAPDGTAATPTPVPVPSDGTTYTVQAGDTLAKIGQTYGIDWRLIAEANGIINPNRILVGDELKIPSNTPGPIADLTHEVQAGETLFIISLNYGVTWTQIAEANELATPYVIYPGQILVIPGE